MVSKIFKIEVCELLSGYVSYLINYEENKNSKISNLTISQRVITAKKFLEYYDIEISPRKFKLKVRIPKVTGRKKEPLTKEYVLFIIRKQQLLPIH
jgi:hypothetical protein